MKIDKLFKFLLLCTTLSSCISSKKVVYLQDVENDTATKISDYSGIKIHPQDMLSIVVHSKTPELAKPFNLITDNYIVIGGTQTTTNQQITSGYVVDKNGEIDFPTLGKLRVAGLTREELVVFIKNKLISENYINDPLVTVKFLNFRVFIAGEVAKPGMYEIINDRITIFEALAMAGDLTVNAKRNNIKIIREKNGERKIYTIDLRTAELFNSPAYYLQQNDYIYVEPNNYRIKDANRR